MSSAPLNPAHCSEQVWSGFRHYQCSNRHKRDGFCGIHHPDAKAARRAKQDAKWAKERADREALSRPNAEDRRKLDAYPHLVAALELAQRHIKNIESRGLDEIDDALKLAREASE